MSNIPEIKLYPDAIGHIGPLEISNSLISYLAVCVLLIAVGLILRRKLSVKPGRAQVLFEMLINLIMEKLTIAFGTEKRARKMFPIIFTIFAFLIFGNYFTLIPFVESVVTDGGTHLFTTPTAHYSLTIAFALILVGASHIIGFYLHPIRHIGNFIKIGPIIQARSFKDFAMAIIGFLLGILDIIGEIAKVISISTRLFGNMFAGGVIIAIVSGISAYTQFVVPIPFIVLGLLTGFVQAFVFAMLGILFISAMVNNAAPPNEVQTT